MAGLNHTCFSDSSVLFPSDDEDSEANYETKQYNNFTALLKGVPPPSSITISKFTVEEMLQKYKDYKDSSGFFFESGNPISRTFKRNPVPFLKYMNSSHVSESVASLIPKVQDRYVQLETMSSCNIWFNITLQTCGSAKKQLRMKQRIGLSPGRRLSHLARRRQFFSSANLQRLANTNDIRQIQIRKSDGRHGERKRLNRTIEHEKLNSSRRALFLSPESGTPKKYGSCSNITRKISSSGSEEAKKLSYEERSKNVEVLRWLSQHNFDDNYSRKRLREEYANHTLGRQRKCPRRSLNFADEEVSKSSNSIATSEGSNSTRKKTSTPSLGKLSENHKNKLLWAVSVVLKENNISRNDENFKVCASTLFHKCRKNLDEILRLQVANGTSEKILHYARNEVPGIFEELGIDCRVTKEEKTERDDNGKSDFEARTECKENINGGWKNQKMKFPELNFIFKTPNKLCRKRPVKSCQKVTNSNKKKLNKRKWHSLESLMEDDKRDSCKKTVETLLGDVSKLGNANQHCDGMSRKESTPKKDKDAEDNVHVEDNSSSFVNDSINFSPIPSSLKESSDSPTVLFPALCKNSEVDKCASSEADSSAEIPNQDKDIENYFSSTNFISQNSPLFNDEDKEVSQVVENKEPEPGCNESVHADTFKESLNDTCDAGSDENNHSKGSTDESAAGDVDGTPDNPSPGDAGVEKAKYKPRKLVVKKSKPNWKVVRQNSEEAENNSNLTLKMRLSHEWEVVCRNSFSSDIGNTSEHEASSLNCSRVSSTNDEKDLGSETEALDLTCRNSVRSYEEGMNWSVSNEESRNLNSNNLLNMLYSKGDLDGGVSGSEGGEAHAQEATDVRRENFKIGDGANKYEESYKEFCTSNFLSNFLWSGLVENMGFNGESYYPDNGAAGPVEQSKFDGGNGDESGSDVSCKRKREEENVRGYITERSLPEYENVGSPILFVKTRFPGKCCNTKKRKTQQGLLSSSEDKEPDNFQVSGEREWERSCSVR